MNNKITLTDEERLRTTLELLPEQTVREIVTALNSGQHPRGFLDPFGDYKRWAKNQTAAFINPKLRKAQQELDAALFHLSQITITSFWPDEETRDNNIFYFQPELKRGDQNAYKKIREELLKLVTDFNQSYRALVSLLLKETTAAPLPDLETEIIFNATDRTLSCGNQTIQLKRGPRSDNQFLLCEAMFARQTNTDVSWDEIVEEKQIYLEPLGKATTKGRRAIENAVDLINKETGRVFGKPLFVKDKGVIQRKKYQS
ncbi:MAG: hypothetical protein UT82_C0003G0010 [Parcubacteria group bacterium GW2011_GWB1_40_14]|nr:MAG: hypothetical protein UT82_C0003G0010 [Parcubacteria group bacterium GW2011_GWB1_40_14]